MDLDYLLEQTDWGLACQEKGFPRLQSCIFPSNAELGAKYSSCSQITLVLEAVDKLSHN